MLITFLLLFGTANLFQSVEPPGYSQRIWNGFLSAASHLGGYGLAVTVPVCAVLTRQTEASFAEGTERAFSLAALAVAAGSSAYLARFCCSKLLPESITKRPKETKAETAKICLQNKDPYGLPSADLAALAAVIVGSGLSSEHPYFSAGALLACAYARSDFMGFHTRFQVVAGIGVGALYACAASYAGIVPLGIITNLVTLLAYQSGKELTPKPVWLNAGCFIGLIAAAQGTKYLGAQN